MVVAGLRTRRAELVQEIFARVRDGAFGLVGSHDAEYMAGLRAAVAAAVEYGLEGIERGDDWAGQVPDAVLEQARRAARIGVSLDIVLRRYVTGHTLLWDCVMDEAERAGEGVVLRGMSRTQASVLDRLLQAITGEYGNEVGRAGYGLLTGDGVPALPAMLSNPNARRARECLIFLAQHPGASNRELATGIGVTHQPQISRLLSRLLGENLVSKRSQGAGKRNAWRLSARGEDVLRMLPGRLVTRLTDKPVTSNITDSSEWG